MSRPGHQARSTRIATWLTATLLLAACSGTQHKPAAGAVDLLIQGGTLFDGSDSPARTADVAVSGDRIIDVGPDLAGDYQIQKVVNGVAQPVAQSYVRASVAAADGDQIRIVRRPDDSILVLVNDQHVIDAGDLSFMTAFGYGIAGDPGASFDSFRVRALLTAGVVATDSFDRADGGPGQLDGSLSYPWWYG